MPVYEYRCNAGHFYEKQEGFDAPNRHKCLKCGKTAKRQLSLPAVIFKGSGFYSTDNRSGSRRNGESSSSESSSSESSSSESSSSESSSSESSSSESSGSKPVGSTPAASTSDGPDHSHGPGGHSHDTKPKVKAAVE